MDKLFQNGHQNDNNRRQNTSFGPSKSRPQARSTPQPSAQPSTTPASPPKTHAQDFWSPKSRQPAGSPGRTSDVATFHPPAVKRAISDSGTTSTNSNLKRLTIDDPRSARSGLQRQTSQRPGPANAMHDESAGTMGRPVMMAGATRASVPSSPSSPVHDRLSSPAQTSQHQHRTSMQSAKGDPYVDSEALPHSERSANSLDANNDEQMLRQPETKPITQEQLVNEVKGIYAGLVMVEKKCVEICQQQSQTTNKLSNEQWQALIALHRTLLHEHHDFFLASQHPTASPALRRLATKYAMPARMWRHGIHSFLELLRHRLPDSLDHMLAFVYLAYSMMALLKESVPSFVETWIECLGDLARYRMAIEEADLRDREIWSNVARMWYNQAADKSPDVGRIQHHLAVLARPNIVQQLFFYSKSLVSTVPFVNARESVMLLFTPFLQQNQVAYNKYPVVESSLVSAWGLAFTRGSIGEYTTQVDKFISGLDNHVARTSSKFKVQGVEIASSLIAGILDFGVEENHLWTAARVNGDNLKVGVEALQGSDPNLDVVKTRETIRRTIQQNTWDAISRNNGTYAKIQDPPEMVPEKFSSSNEVAAFTAPVFCKATAIVTQRIGDKNIMPYMHVVLAFLHSMSFVPDGLSYLESHVPWTGIVLFLNTLGRSGVSDSNIESEDFPPSRGGLGRQLPEDFPLRGLVWSHHYYPHEFFTTNVVDEDERTLELPSHAAPRAERCLWLGIRLSKIDRYVRYDKKTKQFSVTAFAASLTSTNLAHVLSDDRSRTVYVVDDDSPMDGVE